MSQDRTEKPTPKKLLDARKKGQIARSRDLALAAASVAATMALASLGEHLITGLIDYLRDEPRALRRSSAARRHGRRGERDDRDRCRCRSAFSSVPIALATIDRGRRHARLPGRVVVRAGRAAACTGIASEPGDRHEAVLVLAFGRGNDQDRHHRDRHRLLRVDGDRAACSPKRRSWPGCRPSKPAAPRGSMPRRCCGAWRGRWRHSRSPTTACSATAGWPA